MRRLYDSKKPLVPVPSKQSDRSIPIDAKLLDLDVAAMQLTDLYGRGYSAASLRRLCKKEWVDGWHYTRRGTLYKIYLPAVQEWAVKGA